MNIFKAFDIAASGMGAEQKRMDATSHNIAYGSVPGANRQVAVIQPQGMSEFAQYLPPFMQASVFGEGATGEVQVSIKEVENSKINYVYDPDNPMAIKEGDHKGYVAKGGINIIEEMTTLIAASRAYEANATVIESAKSMAMKALEIGRNS